MTEPTLIPDLAGAPSGVILNALDVAFRQKVSRRRGKLVLCVDDDPNIRQIVKHCLTEAGYPALVCRDGEVCLSLLARYEPRLILLDIELPDLDGFQTLQAIRERYPLLRSRIVFLTARRTAADVHSARGLEVDGYIAKPFTRANLVRRLDHLTGI